MLLRELTRKEKIMTLIVTLILGFVLGAASIWYTFGY